MHATADPGPWDRNARWYGRQERLEHHAIDTALALAAPRRDETLVDLATGTGLVLRTLATRAERPDHAIGVDCSPAMLARTGPLPPGWETRRADARRVPLADGTADVVVAAYLLHLLSGSERAEVLREACRLLTPTPAARLVLVTVWTRGRPPAARALGRVLAELARRRPDAWGGLRPLDPTDDLRAAGLLAERRVVLPRRGYPSLVIRARPARDGPIAGGPATAAPSSASPGSGSEEHR